MNKKSPLLVITLMIYCVSLFVGCSDNDENDSAANVKISEKQLVGKWICVRKVYRGESEYTYTESDNKYIEFLSDHTLIVNPYDLFEANFRRSTKWYLKNNILSFVEDGDEAALFEIKSFTSKTLILEWDHFEVSTFKKDSKTGK